MEGLAVQEEEQDGGQFLLAVLELAVKEMLVVLDQVVTDFLPFLAAVAEVLVLLVETQALLMLEVVGLDLFLH
jgi:hypothetical protein